jgi:hypothetical protein
MPLSDIVTVSITSEVAGVTAAGFGTPLILSADAAFPERVRTYTDSDGVDADFTTTSPTYLAALAMFAQNPRPESVKVGRLVNKPTQIVSIDLGSAGILASTEYQIQVTDSLGNVQVASYTTDGTPTETELWAGLEAAFNALVGPTMTAVNTGPNTSLVLTGDTAGVWHGIATLTPDDQYDAGVYLSIIQSDTDAGMAADLAAIASADNDWYGVYCPFASEAIVTVIATYVEANEKIYVPGLQDSATVTAAAGGTDAADDLSDSAFARTAPMYHPDPAEFAAAAWLGRCLPLDPGSETWKFKTLATVATYPITATHQVNLEAKHCNYYYAVAGVNITSQGVVSANEFVDVVRFRDWLRARISEAVFARLAGASNKIAFTDRGIAILEGEILGVLKAGVTAGGLSDDPAPTVLAPKASASTSGDKLARILRNMRFTGTLAGAIHKLVIAGTISA